MPHCCSLNNGDNARKARFAQQRNQKPVHPERNQHFTGQWRYPPFQHGTHAPPSPRVLPLAWPRCSVTSACPPVALTISSNVL